MLVHMPPAVTAAASRPQLSSSSSSSSAASLIQQQFGLAQEAALTSASAAAAAMLATTQNRTHSGSTNAPTAGHQGAAITSHSTTTNSSTSVDAFASGRWVATWVSFPMLPPTEHDPAVSSRSKQQDGAVKHSNPWAAKPAYNQVPLAKQRTAAASTIQISRSIIQTASQQALPFSRAVAPAPYRPAARSFLKARPAANLGYKPSAAAANRATAAAAPAAATAASFLGSWAAQLNINAAALLQPAQSVMQIVSTARSRSLQCVIPPAADDNSGSASGDGAYGPTGKHKNSTNGGGGGGGGGFGSSAFAANSAAFFASSQLFSAALALDKASWHAVHTAAAAKQQQKLQSLCAAFGHAHRELQAKLAAAVFKQQDAAQTNSAAALFSSATSAAAAGRYPATYSKKAAAAGPAAASSAIPLGPVGGVELRSAVKRRYHTSATTPRSSMQSIAASGSVQGPLLPLKQQLTAHTRKNSAPVFAPAHATGVAKKRMYAGSSSSSGSSVWMLNLGWDQRSAWAAAKAAALLSKAEARLQAACQQLLGHATATK
jgi:hypothetical protein